MEFESVIKMHYPYLAAVIYDDNLTLKDFHPSLTDDVSCVTYQNMHHKPFQVNLDKSHLPSMINSTPHHLCHKSPTSKISNTNSDHFIRNLNVIPYHFDMQPHTYEMPSKDTFMPSSCTETFETYLHGLSNNKSLFDMAYTTSPTVEPKDVPYILHVPHDNTMWEHDQNQGLTLGTESTFNPAMLDSNLFDSSKPMGILCANEDTIMNQRQNNQVMMKTNQIKKNKRLQMRRGCKPTKKASIIKGQWTSEEDR